MLKIGTVLIPNRVFSAPMAGVTDKAFRQIIRSCGAGLVYTEMISDMGLVYGQERTHRMLDLPVSYTHLDVYKRQLITCHTIFSDRLIYSHSLYSLL